MTNYRAIEIAFPEGVEITQADMQEFVRLTDVICNRYEATHPGRVMWPFGIGFKPIYIPMTREEEEQRGMEFAEDIFSIECSERADYDAKCTKCGKPQGDHKGHIIDPPAGECEFSISQ